MTTHNHEPGLPIYNASRSKSFGHLCDCLHKIYIEGDPEPLFPGGPHVIVPLTCIDVPDSWYGRIVRDPEEGGYVLVDDVTP